jgi:hypothetical protein
MAGESAAIEVIDVSHLRWVCGGLDQQTEAAQLALTQATSAATAVAKKLAPEDGSLTDVMLQVLSHRRSGPGPGSAPALPPTTTLTR